MWGLEHYKEHHKQSDWKEQLKRVETIQIQTLRITESKPFLIRSQMITYLQFLIRIFSSLLHTFGPYLVEVNKTKGDSHEVSHKDNSWQLPKTSTHLPSSWQQHWSTKHVSNHKEITLSLKKKKSFKIYACLT